MAEKYEMRFFDKAIYTSNYLDDDLTRNRSKHNILSPEGCMVRAEVFLDSKANSKVICFSTLFMGSLIIIDVHNYSIKVSIKLFLFSCILLHISCTENGRKHI